MSARNPWCWCWQCRRRRRRRLTAGLLLLIALAGLAAHENNRTHHSTPAPARTQPATRPSSGDHKRRAPAASPAALESDAGKGLTWFSFHGMRLPLSAAAGPRDTRGGLASGFADTPQGALLAAINIGVRTAAQWGSAIFVPTITHQVSGPAAPALLHAEETAYAQLRATTHVARRPARRAGALSRGRLPVRGLVPRRRDRRGPHCRPNRQRHHGARRHPGAGRVATR